MESQRADNHSSGKNEDSTVIAQNFVIEIRSLRKSVEQLRRSGLKMVKWSVKSAAKQYKSGKEQVVQNTCANVGKSKISDENASANVTKIKISDENASANVGKSKISDEDGRLRDLRAWERANHQKMFAQTTEEPKEAGIRTIKKASTVTAEKRLKLSLQKRAQRERNRQKMFAQTTEEPKETGIRTIKKASTVTAEKRLKLSLQKRAQRERKRQSLASSTATSVETLPIPVKEGATGQLFVCFVCNDEFETQTGVKTHLITHSHSETSKARENQSLEASGDTSKLGAYYHVAEVYECEECSEKFYTKPKFRVHVKVKHKDNLELMKKICFLCNLCNDAFSFRKLLLKHKKEVHDIFTQCPICEENIDTQDLFKKHVHEKHPECIKVDENVYNYKGWHLCIICGYPGDYYKRVLLHTNDHFLSKTFQCDLCEYKCNNQKNLDRHKENIHREQVFCCEICGKAFADRNGLRSHKAKHKMKKMERRECKTCGKTFSSSSSLKSHDIAIHQGLRPFQCSICKKTFTSAPGLHMHKTSVCEKNKATSRVCPICGKVSENYLELSYHKANIHKYGNTEEDVCHLCKKTFKNRVTLFLHNSFYHKDGVGQLANLTCAVCDKSRPHRVALFEHWRKHRDEEPYKCNLCQTIFKYPSVFYLHRKKVHQNEKAMIIADKEAVKTLKDEFEKAHASQFVKPTKADSKDSNSELICETSEIQDNCDTGKYPDTNLTVHQIDSSLNNTDEIGSTQCDKLLETNLTPDISKVSAEMNKNYVDFSRANIPVITEQENGKEVKSTEIVEASIPCGQSQDENSTEQPSPCQTTTRDEVDADDLVGDFSYSDEYILPNEYYDDDIDTDEKPINSADMDMKDPFEKRLVVTLEKLEECRVCDEFFLTSERKERHLSSKGHRAATRETKKNALLLKKSGKKKTLKMEKQMVKSEERKKPMRSKKKREAKTNKLYPCNFCPETFTNFLKYTRHTLQHKKRVSCLLCTEKFVSVRKLVAHYISDHNGEKVVKCKVCDKGFLDYDIASHYDQLKRHMKQHGEEKNPKSFKYYTCNTCGQNLKTIKEFRSHVLAHNDEKHKCHHCSEEFHRESELENHYNELHNGEMPFPCRSCPEKFITEFRLKLHSKVSHPHEKTKDVVCDVCGKTFVWESQLKKHKVTHLSNEERLKSYKTEHLCFTCGKSFNQQKNLYEHSKIHFPDAGIVCSYCSKSFISVKRRNRHIKDVHLKNNTSYSYSARRKRKPPSFNYNCELCAEKFTKPEALQKHSLLHDPTRPFGCDQCSWRFKFSSNLHLHRKNVHQKMGISYPKKNIAKD